MLDRRTFMMIAAAGYAHLGKTASLPTVSKALTDVLAQSGAPAVGYALVGPQGVTALEVGGRRRVDGEEAVATGDLWHIGSNTEAMTAALYAKLVEGGRGAWGAQLPILFPGIRIDPGWSAVTIEDLLSHRSGISDVDVIDEGWLIKVSSDATPIVQQRAEFAARILGAPPAGPRGEYAYANGNYILAGSAIEGLAKRSWEETIKAELFEPLGMDGAGFGPPLGDEPWGHQLNESGVLVAVDPRGVADNPPIFGPAGRVHVSLADYARFAGMFLKGGGGYLRPDSLARLARPRDGAVDGDALGWRMVGDKGWAAGPVIAHEGSNTLWRALADIAPARPVAILVVTNAGGAAGARAINMMSDRLIAAQHPA